MALLHEEHGTRPWEDLVQPAGDAAAGGVPVSTFTAGLLDAPLGEAATRDWSTVDGQPTLDIPADVQDFQRALDRFVASIPLAYRDPARKVAGGVVPWDQETDGPHDLGDWDLERPAKAGERAGINPVTILLRECSEFELGFFAVV